MKILMQRCKQAHVEVNHTVIGAIDHGLLLFIGVERHDTPDIATQLAQRVANYRVFADASGKMNLNVKQAGGRILAVSQFTLAADTTRGLRPGFSSAAPPEQGEALYQQVIEALKQQQLDVQCGQFGADMQVCLINDGPVTFLLEK